MCLYFRNIDFGDLLTEEHRTEHKYTTYNLVANIVHDGEPGSGKGSYRCHVMHKVSIVRLDIFCETDGHCEIASIRKRSNSKTYSTQVDYILQFLSINQVQDVLTKALGNVKEICNELRTLSLNF